jgi:regulator of CtrA degradation
MVAFCASFLAWKWREQLRSFLRGRGMRVEETVESETQPISFVDRLTASEGFTMLFREGMALVEEAAAYLDGEGREDAKALPRAASLAYAAESMRLTTRLMQIASWLLLQRAVNQGEMTRLQAASDRHRVKLSQQDLASNPDMFGALPEKLRQLTIQSMRLQARVIHLDQLIYTPSNRVSTNTSPVGQQLAKLRDAFSAGL